MNIAVARLQAEAFKANWERTCIAGRNTGAARNLAWFTGFSVDSCRQRIESRKNLTISYIKQCPFCGHCWLSCCMICIYLFVYKRDKLRKYVYIGHNKGHIIVLLATVLTYSDPIGIRIAAFRTNPKVSCRLLTYVCARCKIAIVYWFRF